MLISIYIFRKSAGPEQHPEAGSVRIERQRNCSIRNRRLTFRGFRAFALDAGRIDTPGRARFDVRRCEAKSG
jgi:hypothetical protein